MLPRDADRRDDLRVVLAVAFLSLGVWVIAWLLGTASLGLVMSAFIAATVTAGASLLLASPLQRWCTSSGIEFDTRTSRRSVVAAAAVISSSAVVFAPIEPTLAAWLFLVPLALWAAVVDFRTGRIPSPLTYWAGGGTLVLLTVVSAVEQNWSALLRTLLAAAASSLVLFTLAVFTGGGIGMGDVRLVFSLGAVLGYFSWQWAAAGLIVPLLLMFPVAVVRMVRERGSASSGIAAAPYMVAACVLLTACAA
ncbi:prepilin peptidase [Rhodococcus opacus]|nr:prepilin peptidase [Rhodococcus opacus]